MDLNDEVKSGQEQSQEKAHNERVNRMKEDIHDPEKDQEKLQSEVVTIDLPDVSDIPGQENIVVPQLGEMADTTIASDDEEGVGLFGDDDADEDTDLVMGNEADVTSTEKKALVIADEDMPSTDDTLLRQAGLDATDNDGEPLNEGSLATSVSGYDLDTQNNEEDIDTDAMGQGDEENSHYSLGSDSNDNVTEGTP